MKQTEFETLLANTDSGAVSAPFLPMETYRKLVGDGWEGQIETNGWQVDFRAYFIYEGSRYMLGGSWYYGRYTISKDQQ